MNNKADFLTELPAPPDHKSGWPWTKVSTSMSLHTPDGSPWPKISIVTPSFNQSQFLEETIRSVLLQGYPNLEYIVIDGGSTDGSVEIIKKYEPWLTYWVSEKDRGQADAINKGFNLSAGDLLMWLNSDDLILPGSLLAIGLKGSKNPRKKPVLIIGRRVLIDRDSIVTAPMTYSLGMANAQCVARRVSLGPMQESTCWNKKAWEEYGPLNNDLIMAFDLEFFLKIMNGKHKSVFCRDFVGAWRLWGENKCQSDPLLVTSEVVAVANEFINPHHLLSNRMIFKTVKKIAKFVNKKYKDIEGLPLVGNRIK